MIDKFWWRSSRPSCYFGRFVYYYLLIEFLNRMAAGHSAAAREFGKRWPHISTQ